MCECGGPALSTWLACPVGAACRRGRGGASPGGVPFSVVSDVWCQALSLSRPPVPSGGQLGSCDPCVPGAVDVGVGTQHLPHGMRPCGPALRAVRVAEGHPRGGTPRCCEGRLRSGAPPSPASGWAAGARWPRAVGARVGVCGACGVCAVCALNVEVTRGVTFTHTSNPLCERQNRVVEQILRILMKQEPTKDWVHLVPWAVLTMNSQRGSSTGFTPNELFHGGRPAWFFKTFFPEDFNSPVGDWQEHKQFMANQAGTNLRHTRDRELSRQNRLRRPATFKVGDLVLVHHSRLPSWPRNCLQDPYFGPYRIIRIDGSRIHVTCSPRLGGELLYAPK